MKPGYSKGLIKGMVFNEASLLSFNRNNSKGAGLNIVILLFGEILIGCLNKKLLQDLDSN